MTRALLHSTVGDRERAEGVVVHQGISAEQAQEVWLDGWRHGWAARRRAMVTIYGGQPYGAGQTILGIWRDGWRHGASGHRTAVAIRLLYAGRPPVCPITGAPCVGRIECQPVAEQRDGTLN